jgi:hypothetical protein
MDIVGNEIQDYSSELSIQRIGGNTVDVLIKTPGVPENWENSKYSTISPGLADLENGTKRFGNILNMKKISSLKENPNLIKQLLPAGMDCSLTIYPTNTSLPAIEVINKTPPHGDVSIVNRTVLYDYKLIDIYATIQPDNFHENGSEYVCIHSSWNQCQHQLPDFTKQKSGWFCTAFNIDSEDIKSKDFYILTDPPDVSTTSDFHSSWILDTPNKTNICPRNFTSNPTMINSIISDLIENRNREIFVLHISTDGDVKKTFNTYVVGVPRGTPVQNIQIENMKPQPAFFIMKLWIE